MGDGGLVEITVNGRRVRARSDRPMLLALGEGRFPLLGRSLKYHRPRGPFCGTGQCAGCLVRVNGEPSVRSCLRAPRDGDVVTTERGWPTTRHDILVLFDKLFPHHMDTMHGFTRPVVFRSLYTGFVRRFSGQGDVPDEMAGPLPTVGRRDVRVLVVGGGLAADTVRSTLSSALGPEQLLHIGHPKRPRPQMSLIHLPPPVNGFFDALAFQEGGSAIRIRARAVIVATGAYDASLLFAGSDLPGVLTGEGAETLALAEGGPPFRKALLFGGGPRAAGLLRTLRGRIAAIAAPEQISPEVSELARLARVEALPSSMLLEARGSGQIRTARLRDRKAGAVRELDVDAVILAHRRLPHGSSLFQAGAGMFWREDPGAYYPRLSGEGQTTVPGLFAVGEVAGSVGESQIQEGARRAASAVLGDALPPVAAETSQAPGLGAGSACPMLEYYREFLRNRPSKKVLLCPCEDVCLDEMDGVLREGWGGLETAKRISGVGMGLCQGRYCVPEAILVLSLLEQRPPPEIGFITQRPPIWPVPVGALAGGTDEAG